MKAKKVLARVSNQLKKIFGINTTIRDIINGHRTTNIGRFLIKISVIVQILYQFFYLFQFGHDNQPDPEQISHLLQYYRILNLFLIPMTNLMQ